VPGMSIFEEVGMIRRGEGDVDWLKMSAMVGLVSVLTDVIVIIFSSNSGITSSAKLCPGTFNVLPKPSDFPEQKY
jgi:hypothetical protein